MTKLSGQTLAGRGPRNLKYTNDYDLTPEGHHVMGEFWRDPLPPLIKIPLFLLTHRGATAGQLRRYCDRVSPAKFKAALEGLVREGSVGHFREYRLPDDLSPARADVYYLSGGGYRRLMRKVPPSFRPGLRLRGKFGMPGPGGYGRLGHDVVQAEWYLRLWARKAIYRYVPEWELRKVQALLRADPLFEPGFETWPLITHQSLPDAIVQYAERGVPVTRYDESAAPWSYAEDLYEVSVSADDSALASKPPDVVYVVCSLKREAHVQYRRLRFGGHTPVRVLDVCDSTWESYRSETAPPGDDWVRRPVVASGDAYARQVFDAVAGNGGLLLQVAAAHILDRDWSSLSKKTRRMEESGWLRRIHIGPRPGLSSGRPVTLYLLPSRINSDVSEKLIALMRSLYTALHWGEGDFDYDGGQEALVFRPASGGPPQIHVFDDLRVAPPEVWGRAAAAAADSPGAERLRVVTCDPDRATALLGWVKSDEAEAVRNAVNAAGCVGARVEDLSRLVRREGLDPEGCSAFSSLVREIRAKSAERAHRRAGRPKTARRRGRHMSPP